MSSLLIARDAYVAALRAASALEGVHVYTHGGTFDLKQLKAYSREAPALVLTLLKFTPMIQAGVVTAQATWGLVAFTVDTPAQPKDNTVISLTEAAVTVLLRTFAGQVASRPRQMDAKNLFGVEVNTVGVAMWGVEWDSVLDLVEDIDTAPFGQMHVVWDLAPRDNDADLGEVPEAEDDVELPT